MYNGIGPSFEWRGKSERTDERPERLRPKQRGRGQENPFLETRRQQWHRAAELFARAYKHGCCREEAA